MDPDTLTDPARYGSTDISPHWHTTDRYVVIEDEHRHKHIQRHMNIRQSYLRAKGDATVFILRSQLVACICMLVVCICGYIHRNLRTHTDVRVYECLHGILCLNVYQILCILIHVCGSSSFSAECVYSYCVAGKSGRNSKIEATNWKPKIQASITGARQWHGERMHENRTEWKKLQKARTYMFIF